ncbi:MAG: hypothetical protein RMJ28_07415 [Nitrososphaerota archaeon]|nr:hypothetical protein [Candidatus Calditenuaceae archaeon]MDW8074040.1 hypothetical protein [Nitrososphaerota archaeon]
MPSAGGIHLKLVIAATLMAFALILPTAYAQAYNIVVEDARIKVRLTYPPEVEISSCFNIQIEVTALSALDDLYLHLKIVYFYDSRSQTLFNSVLIDTLDVASPGVVLFRNIVLCIPAPVAVDPWLEAKITLRYLTDSTPVELTNTFYLSTVRQVSYERLSARLADANREISRLRSEVENLRSEVSALRTRLEEAAKREEALKARVEELTRLKEQLEKRLAELQAVREEVEEQLSDLTGRYNQLLIDNSGLQERYKGLMDNYAVLQKSYEELRRDYEMVSRDLASMTSLYNDLRSRHDSLRTSYEDSVKTVGQLQGSLSELEKQREVLQAMLAQVSGESGFFRSVAVGQGVGLIALGGGVAAWALLRRRGRPITGQQPVAVQTPPPPPPTQPTQTGNPASINTPQSQTTTPPPAQQQETVPEPDSEIVQKIISGRRITIPSRLADKLGIGIGDHVKIGVLGDKLVLMPIRANGASSQPPPEPASRSPHSSRTRASQTRQDQEQLYS